MAILWVVLFEAFVGRVHLLVLRGRLSRLTVGALLLRIALLLLAIFCLIIVRDRHRSSLNLLEVEKSGALDRSARVRGPKNGGCSSGMASTNGSRKGSLRFSENREGKRGGRQTERFTMRKSQKMQRLLFTLDATLHINSWS